MILVTGATGTLGSQLVPRLTARGETVRALSRKPKLTVGALTWSVGDLSTGEGLAAAVEGVDVIVHAASDAKPRKSGDPAGTERLIDAAREAGRRPHLVYISIVGVDWHPYGYYRAKMACEQAIERSGLPFTILRTTQWFSLLDLGFGMAMKSPVMPIPVCPVQPLDVSEAADRLAQIAVGEPLGRAEEMGGPEVLDTRAAAKQYAKAAGKKRLVLPIHIPGQTGKAFRGGTHMTPEHRQGMRTWEEFLAERFGKRG